MEVSIVTKPGGDSRGHGAARFLAFDLGASNGRAVVGDIDDDGRLRVSEIHRFPNAPVEAGGRLTWNVRALYDEMLAAMRKVAAQAVSPLQSLGIDTWGVDFGLLDDAGRLVAAPRCYRDPAFLPAMEDFLRRTPRERLYRRTGVQILPFNTVFQLHALMCERDPLPVASTHLLMMPDLFAFLLTGEKTAEYTNATTTQLWNTVTGRWDDHVFGELRLPRSMMREPVEPGTPIGALRAEVAAETRLGPVPVIAVASHDTASAVAAVPAAQPGFAFISCGTWSLVGVERAAPVVTDDSLRLGLSNEGGVFGTFRLLKNVAGLWLLEECRRAWNMQSPADGARLLEMAAAEPPFRALIDPNDTAFLKPPDMPEAIREFCRRTGQSGPASEAAMARSILESLALSHRDVLDEVEQVTGGRVECVHMVGGGSRNRLLCRFTAEAAGRPVIAGPAEAAAVGNILMQAWAAGRLRSPAELRDVVRRSFELETFEAAPRDDWEDALGALRAVKQRAAGAAPRPGLAEE